ncbi:MAG TPA: 3-hydroxyacyl-CoA dehydrogenase family protein, partial [Chloroflexota bacterium]|nr:3-hydroxyacyl-CoA dehydrogenase family protein [Chloroflexota bacterium]
VAQLVDGTPGAVLFVDQLKDVVENTWMVVEAVPERLELKTELFGQLDSISPSDVILATNSSSYPSSAMIGSVRRRQRVVNTHYYLPPRLNAVEIMSDGETALELIDLLMSEMPRHGLFPFHVRRESVGFIYNRIWAAIKRESLVVVAEGVSTPEDVDEIFKLSMDAPMGPFRRMDEVGLDVVLDIETHYATLNPSLPESPRRLLREYVDKGWLGKKSGRGFYDDY